MKRSLSVLVAGAALAGVVWLGFRSADDPSYVPWFGVASALLAPAGLQLLVNSLFGSDRESLRRLQKVPEISALVKQAESVDERLQLLREEQKRLDEIVRYEAERKSLTARRDQIAKEAAQIIEEMDAIEKRLSYLNMEVKDSAAAEHLQRLNERIEAMRSGEPIITIGGRQIRVSSLLGVLDMFPILGGLTGSVLSDLLTRRQGPKSVSPSSAPSGRSSDSP